MLTNRRRSRASRAHGPALALGAALVLSGCASGTSAGFPPPEPASATVPASDPSAESAPPASTAQTSEGSEVPPPETTNDTEAGAGSSGSAASPSAVPVSPAAPGEVEKAPEPVRVLYPEIDAELPVEPRGVSDDGQMDVPEDAAPSQLISLGAVTADSTTLQVPAGIDLTEYPVVDVSHEHFDGDPGHSGITLAAGPMEDEDS